MQFAFARALLGCTLLASIVFATNPEQQQKQQQQQQQQPAAKLKRDAGLSFGGSSVYHGPSHKYLPPAVAAGYESTYASLHGNGLASSSGFDFASLDADNSHQHYHHPQYSHPQHALPLPHQHSSLSAHHEHVRPVYVTSGGGSSGGGVGYHHRQHAPKVETYIVQTNGAGHGHHHQGAVVSNGLGGGGGGYKYSGHAGGYLSVLGAGHKQHVGSAIGGGSSSYLLASPSYSSGGASFGHAAVQHRPSLVSSSHGLKLGTHHYAPALSHGLEAHAGYSYDTPSAHFKQPLSSYGVPLLPGYDNSQQEADEEQQLQHQQHQQHQQQEQQQQAHHEEHVHKTHVDQQTPAYAVGHKGLGHFAFQSSKPQALNTDIHQISSTTTEDHNELLAELSKAPFKPSAFLGAKHETSSGYEYATPTAQYLQPPSATGYDYPAPAVLYGPPGQSGDSATPIFEPDATYLPPVTGYGSPVAPTHSYH